MPNENSTRLHAWQSGTGIIHLSLDCTGLDRMREMGHDPEDTFVPRPYHRLADLVQLVRPHSGATDLARLCRLCANPPVVLDALVQVTPGTRDTFATFTLGRPRHLDRSRRKRRPPTSEDHDRVRALREQARATLHEVARLTGTSVTETTRGATVYGFLSTPEIDILNTTVRVEIRRSVTALPSDQVVRTFWSLLNGENADAEPGSDQDPWFLAELICTPA